jgi:hypothetical protein
MIVVAFNRAAATKSVTAPAADLGLANGARLVPLIGTSEGAMVTAGAIRLQLPARTAVAYKVE